MATATKHGATVDAVLGEEQRQTKEFEVTLSRAKLQEIERNMQREAEFDLEEHAPESVKVACREYRKVELRDEEGNVLINTHDGLPRTRLEPYYRTALIESYVPTEMLIEMLLLKRKIEAQGTKDETALLNFQVQQVLKIWQLTEPDMTEEQLKKTLDIKKIRGLFARFFRNLQGGTITPKV